MVHGAGAPSQGRATRSFPAFGGAFAIGALVAAALWRNPSPALGFLMRQGPPALVMEGVSNQMQILLRSPGSDAMRIAHAGVPLAPTGIVAVELAPLRT